MRGTVPKEIPRVCYRSVNPDNPNFFCTNSIQSGPFRIMCVLVTSIPKRLDPSLLRQRSETILSPISQTVLVLLSPPSRDPLFSRGSISSFPTRYSFTQGSMSPYVRLHPVGQFLGRLHWKRTSSILLPSLSGVLTSVCPIQT